MMRNIFNEINLKNVVTRVIFKKGDASRLENDRPITHCRRCTMCSQHYITTDSSGVICFHVDDMLGTCDDLFESKLEGLDELVGFGSMQRQMFDHCGRQYE